MKQFLILIIVFSILFNCNRKKGEKTETKFKSRTDLKVKQKPTPKKVDTIVSYWQTDFDTIRKNQEIKIENDIHKLALITYSLNDNVNENYKGIYHDYATEIILTKRNDTILNKKLTKKAFKDSLNSEFYKLAILMNIEYDGIRSNRLFF